MGHKKNPEKSPSHSKQLFEITGSINYFTHSYSRRDLSKVKSVLILKYLVFKIENMIPLYRLHDFTRSKYLKWYVLYNTLVCLIKLHEIYDLKWYQTKTFKLFY